MLCELFDFIVIIMKLYSNLLTLICSIEGYLAHIPNKTYRGCKYKDNMTTITINAAITMTALW